MRVPTPQFDSSKAEWQALPSMVQRGVVLQLLILFLGVLTPSVARAWGARGHHIICFAATRLVQEAALEKFLESRGDLMGHLCNIPDTYWRSREEWRATGDPSHYLNPENLGRTLESLPTSFPEFTRLTNLKTGLPNGHSSGSLWWRADQFVRLASAEALKAREATPPSDAASEQNDELPYNAAVFHMMVSMGVLGHFVGDASMPLHNTADYDAREAGHAGLHAFYESEVVATLPLSWLDEVHRKAKDLRRRQNYKVGTTLDRMKRLSGRALAERGALLKADALKKQDPAYRPDKPSRKSAEQAAPSFRPLILRQMADSAAQLAQFWDDAYIAAGRPDLGAYKSYRYPLAPDFVSPDYLEGQIETPVPGASPPAPNSSASPRKENSE